MFKKKKMFKKAFTLIEMLIYITVVSLMITTIMWLVKYFYLQDNLNYNKILFFNYVNNNISNQTPWIVFLKQYDKKVYNVKNEQDLNNLTDLWNIEGAEYNNNPNNYFGGYKIWLTETEIEGKIWDDYDEHNIQDVRTFINTYDYVDNNNIFYVEKSLFSFKTVWWWYKTCIGAITRDRDFNKITMKKSCIFNTSVNLIRNFGWWLYYFKLMIDWHNDKHILKIFLLEKDKNNYF